MASTGKHTQFIDHIDHKSREDRFAYIIWRLKTLSVYYEVHEYATGKNIIVDLGVKGRRIGISSHYDVVPGSGGANDNGAAIAVCLDIIERYLIAKHKPGSLRIFFFDEEENGLKGSSSYVKKIGIGEMRSLINMELVGHGDQFALWPVPVNKQTPMLQKFEYEAKKASRKITRFDQIVTNSADHVPFLEAGLEDSFTITCISDEDMKVAAEYYQAIAEGKPIEVLQNIIFTAPTFAHYHSPTDTVEHINDRTIQMTADSIWNSLQSYHGIGKTYELF